jgi:hypothetical protein
MGEKRPCQHSHNGIRRGEGEGRTQGDSHLKKNKKNVMDMEKNLAEKTKARSLLNISTSNRKRLRVVGWLTPVQIFNLFLKSNRCDISSTGYDDPKPWQIITGH